MKLLTGKKKLGQNELKERGSLTPTPLSRSLQALKCLYFFVNFHFPSSTLRYVVV